MSTPPEPLDRPATKGRTVMYLMIIIALGIVVSYNYLLNFRQKEANGRLPMAARVETDLESWLDQNGKVRHLEELKGKVTVVSYLYTTCPQGCAGIVEKMGELQKKFGGDPNFRLLSISLYPEHDRPEVLKAWLDQKGFGGDNWLFLTSQPGEGKGEQVRQFVDKNFRIFAKKRSEAELAKNPLDIWDHQLVMVLMDHRGRVRIPTENVNQYHPFHPGFDYGWFPRDIAEDIPKLLKEAAENKD